MAIVGAGLLGTSKSEGWPSRGPVREPLLRRRGSPTLLFRVRGCGAQDSQHYPRGIRRGGFEAEGARGWLGRSWLH